MDSSPGCCVLSALGTSNSQIFGYDCGTFDEDRVRYVRAVVRARFDQLRCGTHIADPLNIFIKQEPHKLKKIREGRYRLISAVSLVDTMVDRILFGWLGRVVLNTVGRTPCMVGWSPIRGGWHSFYALYKDRPVLCLDKSSWDWTVQAWLIDFWRDFICELAIGAAPWWHQMVRLRFDLLFEEARFKFKDGLVVEQKVRGIMKSGCFLTIICNSVGQSACHYIANLRLGLNPLSCQPRSNGDDTVQRSVPDLDLYVSELERLGAVVKGAKVRHWVEFSGFAFAGGLCYPAYWQKHLYSLQWTSHLRESLRAYQVLYANEPLMFEFLQRVAIELGPDCCLTLRQAQSIMNE